MGWRAGGEQGTRRPGEPSHSPPTFPGLLGFYTVLGRTRAVFGSLSLPEGLRASGSADGPRLWWMTEYSRSVVPNLFGARDQLHGRQFFQGWGWGWFQDDSHKEHTTS